MLKVLYIDPMSYSNLALYDYNLLSKLGAEIEFYFAGSIEYELSEPPALRVFRYQRRKTIFTKTISYIRSLFKLYKYAAVNRIDIIHLQWMKIPLLDFLFVFFLKKKGLKFIYTAHNILPHNTGTRYKKIYKIIYGISDVVIVHTEYAKKQLLSLFPTTSTVVIPHGLLDMSHLISKKVPYTGEFLSEKSDKIVYAFLGNLSYYKGIDILVDAWLSSHYLQSNAKLIIAGRGNVHRSNELDKLESVHIFNEYVSHEFFTFLLNYADFVVMPYREISQSGLLLTVLGGKTKIIVSNLPPLVEPFLMSQDIGFILKENNSCELKEMMERISINDIGCNDQEWNAVLDYYDWTSIGQKTTQLYLSL